MSVALLRPPAVRKLVALLRLPAREGAAILAQAVHEGTMTHVWVDQVLFALVITRRHTQRCGWWSTAQRRAPSLTSR